MKKNQRGVAILMVMSAITLLTIILSKVGLDTFMNKLRVYGPQDREAARLNAEAGINLTLAKLEIYRAAKQKISAANAQKMVSEQQLQELILAPFVYPIPLGAAASALQKNTINDFQKDILITGEISVTIRPVSSLLNPNFLRIQPKKDQGPKNPANPNGASDDDDQEKKEQLPLNELIEKEFTDFLEKRFEEKKANDQTFAAKYSTLIPRELIKELKYVVNDEGKVNDPEIRSIEGIYQKKNIKPKHAPFTDISEMYTLEGWPDEVIELVIDNLTVRDTYIIPVNNLTKYQLFFIFPDLTDEQVKRYFEYLQGEGEFKKQGPKSLETVAEFEAAITQVLAFTDSDTFKKRMEELKTMNLSLGVSGKLFLAESRGKVNETTVTLEALIDLPIKPQLPPEKKPNSRTAATNPNNPDDPNNPSDPKDDPKKTEEKIELMTPRVVSLRIR
jgi:hypothetical protein